ALTSTVVVWNFMSLATIVGPSEAGPVGADGWAAAVGEQAAPTAATMTRPRVATRCFMLGSSVMRRGEGGPNRGELGRARWVLPTRRPRRWRGAGPGCRRAARARS